MPVVTCIDDLRDMARRRVARAVFEYVDCGAYDQSTLRANRADLEALALRQRVGIDVDRRSTKTRLLGEEATMPAALAPIGLLGLNWANGEVLAARAAQRFGIPFTLSTMSICSIEDVAQGTDKPFWFQLYVMRDRGFAAALIERAKAARCSALVLTLDLQIQGQRHRDLKNGLAVPPKLTWGSFFDVLGKPSWALNVLTSKRKSFGNLEGRIPDAKSLSTLSQWIAGQFDPTLSWQDVEWVKRQWGGPLVLKGILDVEDAKIAAAVGDRIEVWLDGGIRSGQSLLKALALGARAVLLGRAFVYGLGAMGQAGLSRA
ncbi:MAG TPA: alpha-hydroxy acid oxidase, partial [Burkholderiales bacterium]|nr:alpha-hydroxy acid oxidase [Burkholderiales bacterium]